MKSFSELMAEYTALSSELGAIPEDYTREQAMRGIELCGALALLAQLIADHRDCEFPDSYRQSACNHATMTNEFVF